MLIRSKMTLSEEILRRRTFAIISHPDAGKTTLTEKLLLYGGAVNLAGSVKSRKSQRDSASDWMELEKQRGISVSSTVLQFDYKDYRVNLLDTPGHKDFSEDTYRVLTAVDSVVMVIDAGKGIESQTLKLFEVCRRRGVPIFTFINKMDRPSREPLDLIDELESVLKIGAYPMNWPIGSGPDFKGVYDRETKQAHFFEKTPGGAYQAPVTIADLNDPSVQQRVPTKLIEKASEELELLEGAGESLDVGETIAGNLTPVFFGSAFNNFGVQLLLDSFLKFSTPPRPRQATIGAIEPGHEQFSGFVFKIQANMDPKHRDRIAFIRICSGRFERDMTVFHPRMNKKVRLSNSQKFFAQDRDTVDEAYAGDVIGVVGQGDFGIGDTITEDPKIQYHSIPRFTPECFTFVHSTDTSQFKRFREGLRQLLQEGVVQGLYLRNSAQKVPLLGAVGPLQFEVFQYRMKSEYRADTRLEAAPYRTMRWIDPELDEDALSEIDVPTNARIAYDSKEQPVMVFGDEWSVDYFTKKNPSVAISELPFGEELTLENRDEP